MMPADDRFTLQCVEVRQVRQVSGNRLSRDVATHTGNEHLVTEHFPLPFLPKIAGTCCRA